MRSSTPASEGVDLVISIGRHVQDGSLRGCGERCSLKEIGMANSIFRVGMVTATLEVVGMATFPKRYDNCFSIDEMEMSRSALAEIGMTIPMWKDISKVILPRVSAQGHAL